MGIYSGSLGLTRYRVLGNVDRKTNASLSKLLDGFKAPPLKIDGPVKSESIGWVRPTTPTDEEITSDDSHWDMSDCRVGDAYLMRLRYEKRKVPASLVAMLYKNKMRTHLQKAGKPMPRSERQQFKQDLVLDLTKRSLPILQFTDLVWRDEAQELIVFSTSKSIRQRAEQLFYQTFGSKLDLTLIKVDGPVALFDDLNASEQELTKRLSRMAKLEASVFAQKS